MKNLNPLNFSIPLKSKLRLGAIGVGLFLTQSVLGAVTAKDVTEPINQFQKSQAKIQLAILLDTSGSMDGLIDQARNQLWQVVNQFSKARRNGVKPKLEVAIYEYGNNSNLAKEGYIRQVSPLTSELDLVSEALFSLTTNGGSEYCGYAIRSAISQLQWSNTDQDIKTIFIAGNEPFNQGPVPIKEAIGMAKARGVTVNTIHAGDFKQGVRGGWAEGARLAGGRYMSINQDYKVAHISAPQDKQIADLNKKLNKTYLPYGSKGADGERRQLAQDSKTNNVSEALLAKRAKTKATSFYDSSSWDLVDAIKSGKVEVDNIEKEALPASMQAMTKKEQKVFVKKSGEAREKIKNDIIELAKERDAYIAKQKVKRAGKDEKTMGSALVGAIEAQAKQKEYSFVEE